MIRNKELVRSISNESDEPQWRVRAILKCAIDYITDELMYGQDVEIRGLGVFVQSERAPRKARDLRTGKAIHLPACRVVRFRTSRTLARKMKNRLDKA